MTWKGESRRHSLARRGIKTTGRPLRSNGELRFPEDIDRATQRAIMERGFSPYFELDLTKYNLAFISMMAEDPRYYDRRKEKAFDVLERPAATCS